MTFIAELAAILETSEKNCIVRAAKLKLLPACNRCRGSGHYSFNGTSSICYGCNGSGQRKPRASEEESVIENAVACKDDGRFALYLKALDARTLAKTATQRVMAAWEQTGISAAYSWQNAAAHARTGQYQRDRDIADINRKMSDAFSSVLHFKGDLRDDAVAIAFGETVAAALNTIAAAKAEFDAYMRQGAA